MKKGLFITIEGIDGSGKTTQQNKIEAYLKEQGFDVISTLEPGALETGKKIRNLLLNSKNEISDRCEMFLFLADRANHIEQLIEPALNAGKVILCDRHTDSTIAYQGFGRGQDAKLLKELNKIAVKGIEPDLTLLFDISAEAAAKRLNREKDRMEKAGLEFQKRVRNGYLELQRENPARIKIINAESDADKVFEDVKSIINELIKRNRGN